MKITEQVTAGEMVLALTDRMDFHSRESFHQSIEQATYSKPRQVILDLSAVSFIDTAGLGLLMIALNTLGEANISLSLQVADGFVREVLTLTSLEKKIPITVIQPELIAKAAAHPPSSVVPLVQVPLRPPLVFESANMQELLLPIIEELEKKNLDFPPLSEVARRVLELTSDPEAHASHLIALIQGDPILAAKIFRVSNSAAYGARKEITTLSQAISLLGLNSVAGIALALSVQTGVFNDRGYEPEVRGIWAHAIATAFYAESLAGIIGKNPDTPFICGLLHSLGKLFVVHTVNQSMPSDASPLPWSTMLTLIEQSYIEVGRQMADAWNFPASVKEAINLHQHYSYHLAINPSKGAALTCLARHVATYHLDSVDISEDLIRVLPVTASLKILPDTLTDLIKNKAVIQSKIDALLC